LAGVGTLLKRGDAGVWGEFDGWRAQKRWVGGGVIEREAADVVGELNG
jgi:hypothetical protein